MQSGGVQLLRWATDCAVKAAHWGYSLAESILASKFLTGIAAALIAALLVGFTQGFRGLRYDEQRQGHRHHRHHHHRLHLRSGAKKVAAVAMGVDDIDVLPSASGRSSRESFMARWRRRMEPPKFVQKIIDKRKKKKEMETAAMAEENKAQNGIGEEVTVELPKEEEKAGGCISKKREQKRFHGKIRKHDIKIRRFFRI